MDAAWKDVQTGRAPRRLARRKAVLLGGLVAGEVGGLVWLGWDLFTTLPNVPDWVMIPGGYLMTVYWFVVGIAAGVICLRVFPAARISQVLLAGLLAGFSAATTEVGWLLFMERPVNQFSTVVSYLFDFWIKDLPGSYLPLLLEVGLNNLLLGLLGAFVAFLNKGKNFQPGLGNLGVLLFLFILIGIGFLAWLGANFNLDLTGLLLLYYSPLLVPLLFVVLGVLTVEPEDPSSRRVAVLLIMIGIFILPFAHILMLILTRLLFPDLMP